MVNVISKIPYLGLPDEPLVAPIQERVPIVDIVDDILFFKDGGACIIMESTSLNFGLLSENEQQAVIAAFAALINSLSYSIQIVVRSQKKDITNYLKYLDDAEKKVKNEKLLGLMRGYRGFISETIKKKNVLGKRFFVVIPFSSLELGVARSFMQTYKKSKTLPYSFDYVSKKVKIVLIPKRDHLVRQAARLGLRLTQLNKQQIVELMYTVYNPSPPPASEFTNTNEVTKA